MGTKRGRSKMYFVFSVLRSFFLCTLRTSYIATKDCPPRILTVKNLISPSHLLSSVAPEKKNTIEPEKHLERTHTEGHNHSTKTMAGKPVVVAAVIENSKM